VVDIVDVSENKTDNGVLQNGISEINNRPRQTTLLAPLNVGTDKKIYIEEVVDTVAK